MMGSAMPALDVHPVTPDRWDDLAELFERPGPRGGRQDTANCWCSVWRRTQRSAEENREALCGLVAAERREQDDAGRERTEPGQHGQQRARAFHRVPEVFMEQGADGSVV
jgi:hypothetical protein